MIRKGLSAIWYEIALAFRLTFSREALSKLFVASFKQRLGWLGDRHLVIGFACALPVFFLLLGTTSSIGALGSLLTSLLSNLVWFGVSASSRALAKRKNVPRDNGSQKS